MSLYNGASGSNFREYANNARFNVATLQTLSIWVRPTAAAAAQWAYVARGTGTTGGEFTLGTIVGASSLSRAQVITGSGSQNLADVTNWVNGKWQHVCQTFDGTVLRIYIDGTQRATLTVAGTFTQSSTNAIRLWQRTDATIVADCALEAFGWWRTCFTSQEVDALARGADFTKIRRDDALILDPLNDVNGVELVAGLGINTGTLSVREKAPIIARSPLITLAKPRDIRGSTRKRYELGPLGGNVTVAITGGTITTAAGLVVPSTAVAPSGGAITTAAGTTTPSTTVAGTGAAITTAAGNVTENHPGTVAVTGLAATTAAGSVTPSTTLAAVGASTTVTPGTAAPATTVAQTGAALTTSAGTVVPSTTVAGTGGVVTLTPGNVTGSSPGATTLTGIAITTSAGTVTPATSLAIAGSATATAAGTPTPATSLAVTGLTTTITPGAVGSAVTVGITGGTITTSAGTVTGVAPGGNVTVSIAGSSLTVTPGTLVATGGDVVTPTAIRRTVSTVLAQFDANLALVTGASSTTGTLQAAGHRFILEKEPLPQSDGDYFVDVESITPGMRDRAVGEAYWQATVVVRVGYYRGGGDAAGGDRQSVMRDAASDAMRLADVVENPVNYSSSTTGISEVRYQSAQRAATFDRGEIWETRFLVRWRSDSFVS